MPAEVTLSPISSKNLLQVIRLELNEGEEKFVAPNANSIAQAYTEPNTTPLAICQDGKPVGFVYYGQFEEDNGEYWIARLMVDKNHRRKGLGQTGIRLVLERLKAVSCEEVFLSIVPANSDARALYEKMGFHNTGRIEDGEEVYSYKF